MKEFNIIFYGEILKVKNTFAPWLILFAAFMVPFILFIEYVEHIKEVIAVPNVNPWDLGWNKCLKGSSIFIFPCVIVMQTALLMNIEHKFNTWKYILTLPINKGPLYISKLLINIILLASYYILLIVFFLFFGWLFGLLSSKNGLLVNLPDLKSMFQLTFRSFFAFLSILAIHFWISIRVKNMFINIGIGLVCIFISIVSIKNPNFGSYYPYSFGLLTVFKYPNEAFLAKNEVYSFLFFIGISVLSYIDFVKRYKG